MSLRPTANHPGAAFEPTGDPRKDGVGAASYANRDDRPDLTLAGEPKIQPMSVLPDFHVDTNDPDPRGMTVVAGDSTQPTDTLHERTRLALGQVWRQRTLERVPDDVEVVESRSRSHLGPQVLDQLLAWNVSISSCTLVD